VTSQCRRRLPACAWHARHVLFFFGITLLLAAVSEGETTALGSYYSWQWGGFSGSASAYASASAARSSQHVSQLSSLFLTLTTPVKQSDSDVSSSAIGTAMLSGVVYYDVNGDGIRDDTDWGIRDATVTLSAANSEMQETTTTDAYGAYSFENLAPDEYTVTLSTPSEQPETASVGLIDDANDVQIASGVGTATTTSISGILLDAGNKAVAYDFPQLQYPTNLISKRILTSKNPGLQHTTAGPIPDVPEPGTLTLLALAGLSMSGFFRRQKRRSIRNYIPRGLK
jgi:hypothetical protein